MKKLIKTLSAFILTTIMLISCTESLELEPISQISNSSFWKTEDDVNGALNGMYIRLRSQVLDDLYFLGEARSETMGNSVGEPGETAKFTNNILTPVNISINWRNFYTIIHDANFILANVPGITFSDEDNKNIALAQAYAMRAFVYFVLVRTWGDVPLVDEPTESVESKVIFRPRSSVKEVFQFIKSDIDKSLSLFPDNSFPTGRCFWSKPSVNALKADVFLWTARKLNGGFDDYSIALNAGKEVSKSDVKLLDNFDEVFRYDNKGNKEVLMSIRFQLNESGQNLYRSMYLFPSYEPVNIDAKTKKAIGQSGGTSLWTVTKIVRDQFSIEDQRKFASFRDVYTFPLGQPDGPKSYFTTVIAKFRGIVENGQRLFLDDVILYRYADILLMIAEAKNGIGQDPSDEINEIRKRAYGKYFSSFEFVNSDRESNDKQILKERLFELVFEGKRWWDLVRFDMAFELVPSLEDRAGQSDLLLFPIEEQTLSLNPEITQNPGY